MLDMKRLVGQRDILLMTLDTLRYDVAVDLLAAGRLPNFAGLIGEGGWERRHSPGNFTYAAHAAMFAGFLPTPASPGKHERLFALEFMGSETTGERTCVLEGASVPEGLAMKGYRTICVGGVGFFNLQNPLGQALPSLFDEQVWRPEFGVTDPDSARHQFTWAAERLGELPDDERVFLFINVSALHQPNRHYLGAFGLRPEAPGLRPLASGRGDSTSGAFPATPDGDTVESHGAALAYVDSQLPILVDALRRRGGAVCVVCSDHGTAYGEDGYWGHRLGHEVVWTVPYAELELEGGR